MKYAIKWDDGNYVRVKSELPTRRVFIDSTDLEGATQFVSISGAIAAIVERTDATSSTWRSPRSLTIVGVKEINTPRYEEVLL